ncbi:MAG: hypothetical protein KGH63_00905 [Candidatus Micrarchaeota archaeon]|nr:hypothetical protein [Candidatus Micrarchaeota archaeon]
MPPSSLTRRPEEEAQPGPRLEAPKSEVDQLLSRLKTITEFTAAPMMEQWKSKARYEDLQLYAAALTRFRPATAAQKEFYGQALQFLFPYMLSQSALADGQACLSDANYCVATYKKYSIRRHDCYTYFCDLANALKRYPSPGGGQAPELELDRGLRYRNSSPIPKGMSMAAAPRLAEEHDLFVISQRVTRKQFQKMPLDLQVGDLIMTDRSASGHNHWGVIANFEGHLVVVSRHTRSIDIEPLDTFLEQMRNHIEIRRFFGQSGYQQHFQAQDISKGKHPAFEIAIADGTEVPMSQQMVASAKKR